MVQQRVKNTMTKNVISMMKTTLEPTALQAILLTRELQVTL